MSEKEICVICKKEFKVRGFGGDRFTKAFLKEFEIHFESIYKDSWKGYYFLCWNCVGNFKKDKQKEYLDKLKDLREYYLENGSPTDYQIGRMNCINFFIDRVKHIIKTPNSLDGSFEAWLCGVKEVFRKLIEGEQGAPP